MDVNLTGPSAKVEVARNSVVAEAGRIPCVDVKEGAAAAAE